jgi:2'-5' RNA ligase
MKLGEDKRVSLLTELAKMTNIQYIAVNFSEASCIQIEKYLKENKIPDALRKDKMHITVMYSTTTIDMKDAIVEKKIKEFALPKKFRIFKTSDDIDALVLEIECEYLKERHRYWTKHGGTFTYPKFTPHITLSYNVGDNYDISKLDINTFPIIELVKEYAEPLNLEFAKS